MRGCARLRFDPNMRAIDAFDRAQPTQQRMPRAFGVPWSKAIEQRVRALNAFLHDTGHHEASWRHPHSSVEQIGDSGDGEDFIDMLRDTERQLTTRKRQLEDEWAEGENGERLTRDRPQLPLPNDVVVAVGLTTTLAPRTGPPEYC